jgi:hypothetical protein
MKKKLFAAPAERGVPPQSAATSVSKDQANNFDLWQTWARKLQQLGLDQWTASILETTGSLTIILAQICTLAQPVISLVLPQPHIHALTDLLEDPGQAQAFCAFLREEETA